MKTKKDLSGDRYGNLLVIKRSNNQYGRVYWECLCDCGNIVSVSRDRMTRGKTKSCGCLKTGPKSNAESLIGKKYCNITIGKIIGTTKHRDKIYEYTCDCGYIGRIYANSVGKTKTCKQCLYKKMNNGYYDIGGWYITSLRSSAIKRNINFNITIQDIWKKYVEQNYKCAYTGRIVKWGIHANNRKKQTASVDRIDPNKGYIKSNIHIVHKEINRFKMGLSHKKFKDLCKEIAEYEKIN